MADVLFFQGKNRWLSNFERVVVVLDNIKYPSVENAYQAAKTLLMNERIAFENCSAWEAKKRGKTVTLRPDWDQVKLAIMRDLCQQKFAQEPYRSQLLATGNGYIAEGNQWGDTFWGVCRGHGENHLGKIIMGIREKLETNPPMKEVIAIIGSREPTESQKATLLLVLNSLDPEKHQIVSGCADGVDGMALATAFEMGFKTTGILPWASYNKHVQAYCTNIFVIDEMDKGTVNEAHQSVMDHHPAPGRLSQGAFKLHMRNYGIIRYADKVFAFPSNKPGGGGTGQGIRLAESLNIETAKYLPLEEK